MILWSQYLNLITKKYDNWGRGVKKHQNMRDIIYGRPLAKPGKKATEKKQCQQWWTMKA